MVLPQSKIFCKFCKFSSFSILLILVFDLKSYFYVCFNLFEWSQVGEIAKKLKEKKSDRKQSENRAKTELCEISQPKEKLLRNEHFVAKPFRNTLEFFVRIFAVAKAILAHECHFAAQEPSFGSCETHCEVVKPRFRNKSPISQGISQLRRRFWHTSATSQHRSPHLAIAKRLAKW